jgi:dTDP-4-amino-4,6-dideoxygalactose transaminase
MKGNQRSLAIFGGSPAFEIPLHVGRPNVGNREALQKRFDDMLDRVWFSNSGPLVNEFEAKIQDFIGVKHCIAICNATVGLEIAVRAMGLREEVIVPAFTFVATAHALKWQEITPVFADVATAGYNIDVESVEKLITPKTTGILGVHLWGVPCDTDAIQSIARKHRLAVLYDAAHAFGCTHKGRMIGNFGSCEVFSFHATKFINSFEGGAIVTNDDSLAEKLRLMRNFGFSGYDRVVYLGINGKMTEVCAAMGITSLESIDTLIEGNLTNHNYYRDALKGLPGISLMDYSSVEKSNYQYIVIRVDPAVAPLNRDELISILRAENVLARKYFWPGCHRMEPYASSKASSVRSLPNTEKVASEVILLPTGQAMGVEEINMISEIVCAAFENARIIREHLSSKSASASSS